MKKQQNTETGNNRSYPQNQKSVLKYFLHFFLFLVLTVMVTDCKEKESFSILSSSENESIEPIITQFAEDNNINIIMKYKGSVDIMRDLSNEDLPYDAVWPASSLWISLGDTNKKVKHTKSIMTSPILFGIKKSLAERLGFVNKEVKVNDILDAIRAKKLKFMMTSATQANSGTYAYFGFLFTLLGNPDIITEKDLTSPELKRDMTELLQGISRSSGSSGFLKELFLSGNYDAMVNYEGFMLDTNKILVSKGQETLYLIYPEDGIAISDFPLGYINSGNPKKEEIFKKFQDYLLSEKVQNQILRSGKRVGFGGTLENADKSIFNPEWGVKSEKVLTPIKLPSAEVIRKALQLYQKEFRKSTYTIFCLDFSGSMKNEGETQLKEAMSLLLDEKKAEKFMINFSTTDKIIVIPFNHKTIGTWKANGNKPEEMEILNSKIRELQPDGGTDIYSPLVSAIDMLNSINTEKYNPSIILMTDGKSQGNFLQVQDKFKEVNKDIPIFPIMFGNASEDQLKEISNLTRAKIFDGRKDLINALRTAKGYN